jgi:hypothetical protein
LSKEEGIGHRYKPVNMSTEEQEIKDERLETHEEGGDDEVSRVTGAGDEG